MWPVVTSQQPHSVFCNKASVTWSAADTNLPLVLTDMEDAKDGLTMGGNKQI